MLDVEEPVRPKLFVVPVRVGACGSRSLRLGRRPDGLRCGLAFSSQGALQRVLGEGHASLTLSLSALRHMLADVDVDCVQVDPETAVRPSTALPAVS